MNQTSPVEPADREQLYPPPHPRRPVALAVLGIVLSFGCPPLGAGLGVASIRYARRDGGRYLWGVLAISVSVVVAIVSTILLGLTDR